MVEVEKKRNIKKYCTQARSKTKSRPLCSFFFFLLQFIENRLQTLFAVILQYRDTLIHVRIEW